MLTTSLPIIGKPRLRGVVHQWAFFVALPAGLLLVLLAPTGRAALAAGVYAFGLCALLGASALYHRGSWSLPVATWLRRLDHSMICVLIAGTYTPFSLLVLEGTFATVVLILVWSGALAGVLFSLLWIDAPSWAVAAIYLTLGWVAAAAFPSLARELEPVASSLLAVGGLLYTVGAVVYARRRPDPIPAVFGFHEVFHVLVVVAALLHYVAIAAFVVPSA